LTWSDGVSELAHEHRPDESVKGAVTLSKAQQTGGGRSPAFEPIMIDRLFMVGKLSFNGDRRFTSRFILFSSSQKANDFVSSHRKLMPENGGSLVAKAFDFQGAVSFSFPSSFAKY
jgi:hypothetical protein